MEITAKFASVCPCCSARIAVGSKVEWSKGSKAQHVACGQGPAVAAASSYVASRPVGRRTGCRCGSREIGGDLIDSPRNCSDCLHDSY